MICSKIYLSQTNTFLFDDLLGDFYEELQACYNDLFMNYAEDLILDDSSYFILDESNTMLNENKVLKLNCSIKNKNAINFYNKFNGTKTINNDEVTYELEL